MILRDATPPDARRLEMTMQWTAQRYLVQDEHASPWRPAQTSKFVMVIRRYGNRSGWWISPEQPL